MIDCVIVENDDEVFGSNERLDKLQMGKKKQKKSEKKILQALGVHKNTTCRHANHTLYNDILYKESNLTMKEKAELHKMQKAERKYHREMVDWCDQLVLKQMNAVPKDRRQVSFNQ